MGVPFELQPATALSNAAVAPIVSISLPPGVYGGGAIQALFNNQLDPAGHPYFAQVSSLQVSAHFLLRRDGQLLQFVSCDQRAWHAGPSHWAGRDNCNDWSIGIELEGLEGDTFEPAQYQALSRLLRAVQRRYPVQALVGHEHVAPGRKHDPGPGFDWAALQQQAGFPAALALPASAAAAGQAGAEQAPGTHNANTTGSARGLF